MRRAAFCQRPQRACRPEDVATELGIELCEVIELVRRYQDSFDWTAVPIGKLKLRS
jgi:hypothetical protein